MKEGRNCDFGIIPFSKALGKEEGGSCVFFVSCSCYFL